MLRDTNDERTIMQFVLDECSSGDWQIKFYVTKVEDVKADPDAAPDERFNYEGAARDFISDMRLCDPDVADVLDEKIMAVADDILCDFAAKTMEISILISYNSIGGSHGKSDEHGRFFLFS